MGTILALDWGKFKNVPCLFGGSAQSARFPTVPTEREGLRTPLTKEPVDLVVIDRGCRVRAGTGAGQLRG